MIVLVDGPKLVGVGRTPGGVLLRRKRLIKKHNQWVSAEHNRRSLEIREAFRLFTEIGEGSIYSILNLRDCVRMTVRVAPYAEENATLDLADRQ